MKVFKNAFAAAISSTAMLFSLSGQARHIMVKDQAPGFYRMMLGNFEITALNDGVVGYDTRRILPSASPEEIAKGLQAAGLSDPVGMSYNAFLVNTGEKLVLIDTGTGGKLADSPFFHGTGRLLTNLRAAGYRPEQIDEIYITHRGQDHIGGLTTGKERTFPNAIVRVPKREFDIFLDPEQTAAAIARANNNEEIKEWMQFTRDLFEPYIQAGKLQSFSEDIELTPGIRALATHGHTPGHTSYVVASKEQTLIVMGDLILMGAMQFAQPSLITKFDADHLAAATQRRRILELAAAKDYWVAGAHLSFPGLGHLRATQENYRWVPVNYTIPQ